MGTVMNARIESERGFTLIESMIAMLVLTVGLLALAGVLTNTVTTVSNTSGEQLAKDKAYETLESILAARETRLITWDQLKNTNSGGRILVGAQPITLPGPDNIIGTIDDQNQPLASVTEPGPDQALGTGDDITTTLNFYTRQIDITNVSPAGAPDTLRQIAVTVRYRAGRVYRQFTLTTLVSSYS
jgi:prepilin-type N-terminal cleavage/methylation domain-containing protein